MHTCIAIAIPYKIEVGNEYVNKNYEKLLYVPDIWSMITSNI